MRKIFAGVLALILIFALTTGCGPGGGEKDQKGGMAPLEIGLMPDTDSLPFIIAREKGYFDEEGVKVNLRQFKSAMDRDSALQSGNLDGAVSDLLAVAFAKSGGFDVKVISASDGSYRLVAGKEESIATPKDLTGREVAVSRNTIIEYVTDRILEREGMAEDSIEKVIIPQIPTRLEMLQNGKLAAATLPEPMASIAVHNGCRLLASSDQMGINPGVIMVTSKALNDKKASLQAMYRAYNRAVKYINETPRQEYMGLVVEKGGFPPAAEEALNLPEYHEAVLPRESDVTECVKWLREKSLIQESYGYDDIVADILGK